MSKLELNEQLQLVTPLLRGISQLFSPWVEIVVHDLEQGTIAAILCPMTGRRVGDPSPLKELNISSDAFPDIFEPYFKNIGDGMPFKCTSVTLRNAAGKPIGLICINVSTGPLQEARQALDQFLTTSGDRESPVEGPLSDSEAPIGTMIEAQLRERGWSAHRLDRDQKRELVLYLHHKGIFHFKYAVPVVSEKLNLSRASIYNYLKKALEVE